MAFLIDKKAQLLGVLVLTALASTSNAELIEKSRFEAPSIESVIGKRGSRPSTWRFYDTARVKRFSGSNIEIKNSDYNDLYAQDGDPALALIAHLTETEAFSSLQDFDTHLGSNYGASFFYKFRGNSNEAFNADISSGVDRLLKTIPSEHTPSRPWDYFSGIFKAITETTH